VSPFYLHKVIVEISLFSDFSRWQPAAILNFPIPLILMANELRRLQMHHRVKFNQNWSSGCRDIAVFPFFKMAASGHLKFFNFRKS